MSTDWKKYGDSLKQPSESKWREYGNQIKAANSLEGLRQRVSNLYTSGKGLEGGAAEFLSGWKDEQASNAFYSSAGHYYAEAESIKNQLESNAKEYKKIMGDKNYKTLYDSLNDAVNSKGKTLKNYKDWIDVYSQFKTADDYDKAKREYGYYTKYQGKTYDDISKHLASDDYKTMRRRGLVSDEENTWLKNFKYNIATASELEKEIADLENEVKQDKSQKGNNAFAETIIQTHATSNDNPYVYQMNVENYQNQQKTEKEKQIEILKTTLAQKKKQEEFSKKWDDEVKGLDNTISVPTNDQLKSVLVTDDEIALSSEAASNASDGTPAGQAGAVIGKFISDIIKDSKDETDFEDYAKLLTETEKKNIINLSKTNPVKATEYFNDLITVRLDAAYNEQIKADAAGFTSSDGWAALGGSLGSVVTSLGSGIETVGNWLTGSTDRRSRLASTTTGLREGTKTHWDGTWGEDAWDFLYDTGMSAADSLAAAGLSAVVPFSGEILLGASAAANTYNDMLDRGVTGGDAILGSVAAGVAEGLFEHISIGKILDAGDITKGWTKAGLKQAAKKVGTDMLVNASEETLTEISNIVTDNLINGDLSSYAIAAEQYYMQGYSAEEAKKMAAQDLGKQVAMAGLSGALMGFGFGAGGSVVGLSNSNIKNSKAGNAVLNAENGLDTLKSIANKSGFKDIANEAEKLTENSKPSEVGYVFNRLYEQSLEKSINEMTPILTQNGATKGGVNSSKGFATQIVKTALDPQSEDKRANERTLRVNNITKDVYAGFVDEGKYGADTLLQLNELTAFKTKTNEQIAEVINRDIAKNRAMAEYAKPAVAEAYESNRPTFGANELPAEVMGNLEKISANGTSGPVSQIFGKNVAANFEKQRPNPKKAKMDAKKYLADTVQIVTEQEEKLKAFGKENGIKIEFVDGLVDGKAYGRYADGTIVISRYAKKPMRALFKHEFGHSVEKAKGYEKFQKYLFDESKAFGNWLTSNGYSSWKEAVNDTVVEYKEHGVEYKNPYATAKSDLVADFVGDCLFGEVVDSEGNPIEITDDFLAELKQKDRNLFQRFVEWVNSIIDRLKANDIVDKDIIKLEQKFKRLTEQARKERTKAEPTTNKTDGQYSLPDVKTKEQFDKILEEKYEIFSTKKPIRVTSAEWSSINSLRTQRYGDASEESIPTIDYFEIGTYNEVNQGYVYFIRNADKRNFSIVSKRMLRKADKRVNDGKSSGTKTNGTRSSQRLDKSGDTSLVGNRGTIQTDAFVFESETGSDQRGNFDNRNDTSRRTIKSDQNQADSIDGPAYSLPDLDTEYMKAVESGDMETAQRLVDEVAKKSGYTVKGVHATTAEFTVFDVNKTSGNNFRGKGIYFTNSVRDVENNYENYEGPDPWQKIEERAYELVYDKYGISYEDTLTSDSEIIDKLNECYDIAIDEFKKGVRRITAYLRFDNPLILEKRMQIPNNYSGYDGIIDKQVYETFGHSGMDENTVHYVVFNPNNIKSADPVTYDDNGNVIPLSKRFNSEYEDIRYSLPDIPDIAKTKSTDELSAMVERGEITPTQALNALADQFGTMPKGENAKVDVVVPSRVSRDKHVMRWVRTAAESGHLDEGMRNDQRKELLKGAMSYQVISDKAAVQKADDAVRDDFAGAVQKWEDIINSGKQMTKFDIALGERLLQQAAENGHASDVIKYTAELAELGTRMGQNIQALRLLKKMTGIGKLYYIQRTVNSLNKDIEQKYKGKKQPVKIDADLAKILANSKNTAEMETVESDMLKDIANQMPSTFLDKWNAWRYLSMLGNPRTHIRNIMGNAVFVPAIRIRHGLSYAGERFIPKDKRTKILGLLKPEYRDFARSDFEAMKDILTGGGKMNPSDKIRDQQKIFKTKALEIIRNKNFALMEAEDMLFLKMHYVRALGSALQAKGIDIANISDEQLNVARLYAIKEAQKATYRDASAVAEALNRFQYSKSKSVRAFGMLVEGILPFKKTPINILKRGVEYSPVGLVTSLTKGIVDLKKGKITADEFIDGISAGLTGTGIMALGMLLQSLGIIVGGLDYDDEDALERMFGAQPYSIQVGDISYTIDWMAPAVLPFLVGAEVEKFLESDNERDPIGFAVDALAAIGEPLTELSMLSGLNDAIEAVAYSDNKLTDMAISAGTSYLSQAFPTIGGQIARTFDDTRRSNFVDKNSAVPKGIQTAYQKALGKIPFAENTKVPYIDAWGRTEVNDNVLLRAFENFVSPGYVSVIDDDKVNKEIAEVYVNTGASGVLPKRAGASIQVDGETKNLTADEYVQYATDKGQYSRKYLEDFINHPMYSGLDNQSKADIISDLYSYANAKAKSNISDYDYTTVSTYKTAAKLESAGIDPVSYYIARVATSTENADTDGSGAVSKKEKQKALKNAGFSNSEVNTIINVNKK